MFMYINYLVNYNKFMQFLKHLRLFGQKEEDVLIDALALTFRHACNASLGCLTIGDTVHSITDADLAGLPINAGTHISLYGHGNNINGTHVINLLNGVKYTFRTLKKLDTLTSDPLQIYLDSCYGLIAVKEIVHLKPYSTLIIKGPDLPSNSFSEPDWAEFASLPWAPAEKFLHAIQKATLSISFAMRTKESFWNKLFGDTSPSWFNYTYAPVGGKMCLSELKNLTLHDLVAYVTNAEKEFIEICHQNKGCSINTYPPSVNPVFVQFNFCNGYIYYLAKLQIEGYLSQCDEFGKISRDVLDVCTDKAFDQYFREVYLKPQQPNGIIENNAVDEF